MNNQSLFISVLNRGKAEKFLSEMRVFGLVGGAVFLGEGTASNHFLEILGLEEIQKEIIFLPIEKKFEDVIYEMMLQNFQIDQKRRGIAFSIPLTRYGSDSNLAETEIYDLACFEYQCVFVVVDEGKGKEVMHHARSVGQTGGTIIHGRGAGIPSHAFFPFKIEPQKDLAMLLVKNEKVKPIKKCLLKEMDLGQPSKGIMFGLPVSRFLGGYQV